MVPVLFWRELVAPAFPVECFCHFATWPGSNIVTVVLARGLSEKAGWLAPGSPPGLPVGLPLGLLPGQPAGLLPGLPPGQRPLACLLACPLASP